VAIRGHSTDGNTTDRVVEEATDTYNRSGLETLHVTPSIPVSFLFVSGLYEKTALNSKKNNKI
jgi:hypothetical protein